MIVFDLINDEALLFYEAIKVLLNKEKLNKEEILGVMEGNRWKNDITEINTINRLHFFDVLDSKNVNIEREFKRIAKEYDGFNIFACDRYLIKKPVAFQKKMLVYSFLFYEDLFSKNITHYFTTGIAFTYNLISAQVSKKFCVKHISFYATRFGNRTAISESISNIYDEVNDLYQKFSLSKVTKEMYEPILKFKNKPVQPIYMKNAVNSFQMEFVFLREFFIRFKRYYLADKHKYDFFTRNPFELSKTKLNKIFNAKKLTVFNNNIFDDSDEKDDFFLFPLHMQPEASTLILAPFYVNQLETAINLSKVLPLDTFLYVKEHKSAFGEKKLNFYKELKKYPNIKLISYQENTFNLIKKSKGVISLSSTVGLEALILEKPVITLGDIFYNDSKLTFKASSFFKVKELLALFMKPNFLVSTYFENYKERITYFIFCLTKKSCQFEFDVAKLDTKKIVLQEDNVSEFASCLDKLIRK